MNRKTAIFAGVLFIIGMVAGVLSIVPAIDAPDFLVKASANANQVIVGALFQFIMAIAYAGIAIILYPILRKYNETLALGFLSFRIIAAAFLIIGVTSILLLLALSQEFVKAEAPTLSYFEILGDLLRTGRDLINHIAMPLTISVGGLMFYFLLYQTKLIPRWLSILGLVATISGVFASLLVLFHFIEIITPTYIILALPTALQELTLAVWLIVEGFNPAAIKSKPAR